MTVLVDVALLAALASVALMAGLFFMASVAVMPGLALLPAADGAAAMQAINRAILNPVFLVAFVGSAMLCVLIAIAAPLVGTDGAGWVVTGAVLHLVGGIGVTAVANVLLNNRLDAVDPTSPAGAELWELYQRRWTAWNHVRTVACTLAVVAFGM